MCGQKCVLMSVYRSVCILDGFECSCLRTQCIFSMFIFAFPKTGRTSRFLIFFFCLCKADDKRKDGFLSFVGENTCNFVHTFRELTKTERKKEKEKIMTMTDNPRREAAPPISCPPTNPKTQAKKFFAFESSLEYQLLSFGFYIGK